MNGKNPQISALGRVRKSQVLGSENCSLTRSLVDPPINQVLWALHWAELWGNRWTRQSECPPGPHLLVAGGGGDHRQGSYQVNQVGHAKLCLEGFEVERGGGCIKKGLSEEVTSELATRRAGEAQVREATANVQSWKEHGRGRRRSIETGKAPCLHLRLKREDTALRMPGKRG